MIYKKAYKRSDHVPEKAEGTEILTIRISKHINEQLEKLVEIRKFPSKSDIIRTAIIEYLANHKKEFFRSG